MQVEEEMFLRKAYAPLTPERLRYLTLVQTGNVDEADRAQAWMVNVAFRAQYLSKMQMPKPKRMI